MRFSEGAYLVECTTVRDQLSKVPTDQQRVNLRKPTHQDQQHDCNILKSVLLNVRSSGIALLVIE